MDRSTPGLPPCPSLSPRVFSNSLSKLSIGSEMLTNHLILCHLLFLLPSIIPSIKVLSSELALCIKWPKYWSFSFSISPSNEYSELISFKIGWFDLPCKILNSQFIWSETLECVLSFCILFLLFCMFIKRLDTCSSNPNYNSIPPLTKIPPFRIYWHHFNEYASNPSPQEI